MKVKGEGEQGKKFEFRVRVRERRMKESGVREVIEAVNAAKDEIIGEFHKVKPVKSLPMANRRGPKNTKMMKVERKILETYLEIDCHRDISSCTPADAHHIWNLPENKPDFSAAANRTDASRGYPDPVSLCNAVLYWHDKKILKRHSLSISK